MVENFFLASLAISCSSASAFSSPSASASSASPSAFSSPSYSSFISSIAKLPTVSIVIAGCSFISFSSNSKSTGTATNLISPFWTCVKSSINAGSSAVKDISLVSGYSSSAFYSFVSSAAASSSAFSVYSVYSS
jgi:hypothetical protein